MLALARRGTQHLTENLERLRLRMEQSESVLIRVLQQPGRDVVKSRRQRPRLVPRRALVVQLDRAQQRAMGNSVPVQQMCEKTRSAIERQPGVAHAGLEAFC